MIDLDTVPRRMTPKMPVNFATYLLSSSPPATNLELLSYAFSPEASRDWAIEQERRQQMNSDDVTLQQNCFNDPKKIRQSIKPIIIKKDETINDADWSDSASSSGRCTPTSPCSPGKSGKKVSFADHKGFALATVKIMAEPSDQPPVLGPEIIKSITKGVEAEVTGLPPYKISFVQPASDYVAFRGKIERDCVSLENVILRDYNLIGTVKVKNISFEKRVFIRCTFDSWKSSQDFEAKYVTPIGSSNGHGIDTFSFEFDISTDVDPQHTVQFAVCFETPTNQYWDSNNGENYIITPTDFNSIYTNERNVMSTVSQPGLSKTSSWTEYNCWRHVDTSSPYY